MDQAEGAEASKNMKSKEKSPLKPLEETLTDKLGQWYMANHGVSAAALIEDMRTVPRACLGLDVCLCVCGDDSLKTSHGGCVKGRFVYMIGERGQGM